MGNGQCERFNRTLLSMLRTLDADKKTNWKTFVPSLVHSYNCTRCDATGYSPFYLMFGRHPLLPVDVTFGLQRRNDSSNSYDEYVASLKKRMEYAHHLASAASEEAKAVQKDRYDLRSRGAVLDVGDRVLLRNVALQGKSKLADRWQQDVFVVESQPNKDIPVYKLRPENGHGHCKTLHRNLLLPIGTTPVLPQPVPCPRPQRPVPVKRSTRNNPIVCSDSETSQHESSDEEEEYVVRHATVVHPPIVPARPVPARRVRVTSGSTGQPTVSSGVSSPVPPPRRCSLDGVALLHTPAVDVDVASGPSLQTSSQSSVNCSRMPLQPTVSSGVPSPVPPPRRCSLDGVASLHTPAVGVGVASGSSLRTLSQSSVDSSRIPSHSASASPQQSSVPSQLPAQSPVSVLPFPSPSPSPSPRTRLGIPSPSPVLPQHLPSPPGLPRSSPDSISPPTLPPHLPSPSFQSSPAVRPRPPGFPLRLPHTSPPLSPQHPSSPPVQHLSSPSHPSHPSSQAVQPRPPMVSLPLPHTSPNLSPQHPSSPPVRRQSPPDPPSPRHSPNTERQSPSPLPRRSTRTRRRPAWMDDNVYEFSQQTERPERLAQRVKKFKSVIRCLLDDSD